MLYDPSVKKCICNSAENYIAAGSSQDACVLESQYNQLVLEGFVESNYQIVTYYSVVNSRGPVAEAKSVNSDIFRQFYIEAAVGCRYNEDP